MKVRPRASVAMASLMAICLTMTACGTSTGGDSGGGDGDQVTLRIWDYSAEQVDFHKKVAAQFTEENPNIKIKWRSIAEAEYTRTLPLAFQSHQAPDIFYWSDGGPMTMSLLLNQKWIQPLAPDGKPPAEFTKRWPDGSFLEGVNIHDGKTYGFPFSESLYWGPGYMYINKQVFKKAGLDPAKPPRTWSDLKKACGKIKSSTEAECIASPSKGTNLKRLWYALSAGLLTLTDHFFDRRTGRFALNDPKVLKTFRFIQELDQSGYIAPGTNDKGFSRQQFAAGQAAIYMDGTWMPSVWASQGFTSDKYTVATHPVPDSGVTGALPREPDGNKYWVSSQTKHHEAAWKFLQWMTKPDGYFIKEYFKAGLGTLAFADNAKYVADPALKKIMQIAEQPGFRVRVPLPVLKCPDLAKSQAFVEAISKRPDWEYEAMVKALVDDKPLKSVADKIAAERNKVLAGGLKKEAAQGPMPLSLGCRGDDLDVWG